MKAYKLFISKMAEKIDTSSVPNSFLENIDTVLDPKTHDIYKILIGYQIISISSKRKAKKNSLEKTDYIFVELSVSSSIFLLGIHPISLHNDDFSCKDVEGEVLFELNLRLLKFSLKGKFKSSACKQGFQIFACRIPPKAQWIYSKLFLLSGNSFNNYIICQVPKNIKYSDRHIICSVESKNKNRTIDKIFRKKIYLV